MPEPTLRDVAEIANVHPGTASRALNPRTQDLVNTETVQRVLAAAKQLGYRPNSLARALKTNQTFTVGMLIPDLTNPLFPPIVRGVESVLEPAGYTTLLANTDNMPDKGLDAFNHLLGRQVDGFLVATSFRNDPLAPSLADLTLPVVLINRVIEDLELPSVVDDDLSATEAALSHLISLGHQTIAYISGPTTTSTGHERKRAFHFFSRAFDLPWRETLVIEAQSYSTHAGFIACQNLLEQNIPFSAIVCGNDLIALGAIDALQSYGLSCPEDVSVIGYNDMPFLDRMKPSLTSINVSHHDIGAEAARLLLRRFEAPDSPVTTVTLPTSLVVRNSTAKARAPRL